MLLFFFYELAFSIAHFLTPALSHMVFEENRFRTSKANSFFML